MVAAMNSRKRRIASPRAPEAQATSDEPPKCSPEDLFLRLGREQQGIALAPAGIRRIRCFRFRYVLRVDGDDTSAAPMRGKRSTAKPGR